MALYRAVESRPVMAPGMMTGECVGREILKAGLEQIPLNPSRIRHG
jgi:hypothetical protein